MAESVDEFWEWQLELKLRRTTGNAFQTFLGDLLEACFSSDYIRVKPYGSLGDSGCDGYRQSTGCVYACYGAQNGAAPSVAQIVEKMGSDFNKASTNLKPIMKRWHFAHNIIEGMPIEAILKLNELHSSNNNFPMGFVGPPKIAELMADLSVSQREKLLGPIARNEDYRSLQMTEVRDLVDALVDAVYSTDDNSEDVEPVSPAKLSSNKLSGCPKQCIRNGRINAPHIIYYFEKHPNPMLGETIAKAFRTKYEYLKAEGLSPDNIFYLLYTYVAGTGQVSVQQQVAAHSLLSYLFDRCDIFENPAPKVAAE